MPSGQQYATNVPQTNLSTGISAIQTVIPVNSSAGWPSVPFTAVFNLGQSNQEPVDVTNVAGTNWTVTRAVDGTSQFTHAMNATVTHADIGRDFRESRSHIDAATSPDAVGYVVHGLTGGSAVVGTLDIQTLSNKTLPSPTLSGTVGGSYTVGGTPSIPSISGNTTSTGNLTYATIKTSGLTGATLTPSPRTVGASNSGPPASGTFAAGDIVMDTQPTTNNLYNTQWYCVTAGTPGTWVPLNGMTLFFTSTLTSGAGVAITVPQVFNHIKIVISARGSGATAAGYDSMSMQFNSVSSGTYTWNSWFTTQGASAVSVAGGSGAASMQCAEVWNSHFATHGRGYTEILIPNYREAVGVKGFTAQSIAGDGSNASIMQTYNGFASAVTAAITSISLTLGTGNFIEGELSAYGIL